MATNFGAFLFAFFALSYASSVVRNINVIPLEPASRSPGPAAKKIVHIIPLSRQEIIETAVSSFTNGFGRLTRVGITVTRDAGAILEFDITVTAIDARMLDRSDESILELLTDSERAEFLEVKENFDGGLSIPLLGLLGLDLSETITTGQIEEAAESVENFETKFNVVNEILMSASDTRIRINGSLTATGLSNVPTVAFAFIKLAQAQFPDGSSQLIVSSRPEDVFAADRRGEPLDSSNQEIDVTCVSGRLCES